MEGGFILCLLSSLVCLFLLSTAEQCLPYKRVLKNGPYWIFVYQRIRRISAYIDLGLDPFMEGYQIQVALFISLQGK